MNICLISREYPTDDHTGGIGTYTEKTARALAALGQTVHVITEARGAPSTRVEDGVTVARLAAPRTHPHVPGRALAVARAVQALPDVPDIVQVCEHRAEGCVYALRKRPNTTLITRLATPSFLVQQLNSHGGGSGPRTRLIDRLERLQTRRSDAIISPTDALAEIVCRRWEIPRQHVTTLHTGVDFAQRYASQAADLPAELHGLDYILYFGRLEERKGVHVLAQALPEVLAAHPRLRVVFAGNDLSYHGQSMRAFVEQCNAAYRSRLLFFPRLSQPRLYPLLAHALLAVLPSLWENLANTCLEALDMGLPVLATRGCGFGEVIVDGSSGVLVPPGDVRALRNALLVLLGDRAILRRMAGAAHASAIRFGLTATTQHLLHFYEGLRGASQEMAGGAALVGDGSGPGGV